MPAKKKALTAARQLAAEVNAFFGEDVVRMGSDPSLVVEFLPTGVGPIDHLLGGGLPRNRFTEIYGYYSTLKSYIGLRAIALTQESGGVCALIDTEHAFDPLWAKTLGVDVDALLYRTPETGEEAIDLTEFLIRNQVDLVVWDSVAATLPQAEQTKRMSKENVQPARLAALMSTGLRKLTTANSRTAVLWINQTRINVGQMFGNPEVTPGGRALPFYASYRISIHKGVASTEDISGFGSDGKAEKHKQVTAYRVRAKVEKSKLSAPHGEVTFIFDLKTGLVDEAGFALSQMLTDGTITSSTRGTYTLPDGSTVRGIEKVKAWVQTNGTTSSPGAQGRRKIKVAKPRSD